LNTRVHRALGSQHGIAPSWGGVGHSCSTGIQGVHRFLLDEGLSKHASGKASFDFSQHLSSPDLPQYASLGRHIGGGCGCGPGAGLGPGAGGAGLGPGAGGEKCPFKNLYILLNCL